MSNASTPLALPFPPAASPPPFLPPPTSYALHHSVDDGAILVAIYLNASWGFVSLCLFVWLQTRSSKLYRFRTVRPSGPIRVSGP